MERRTADSLVTGPGVVTGLGARGVGVVCSLVGVLSLRDSALGELVQVSGCGASGGSAISSCCRSATFWFSL